MAGRANCSHSPPPAPYCHILPVDQGPRSPPRALVVSRSAQAQREGGCPLHGVLSEAFPFPPRLRSLPAQREHSGQTDLGKRKKLGVLSIARGAAGPVAQQRLLSFLDALRTSGSSIRNMTTSARRDWMRNCASGHTTIAATIKQMRNDSKQPYTNFFCRRIRSPLSCRRINYRITPSHGGDGSTGLQSPRFTGVWKQGYTYEPPQRRSR